MATVILKKEYLEYVEQKVGKLPLSKLFVDIKLGKNEEIKRVALSELYVSSGKKNELGVLVGRKLNSFIEFMDKYNKNGLFTSETLAQPVWFATLGGEVVKYKTVEIPTSYDSTSINVGSITVPYGLKRNLKVEGEKFEQGNGDKYILIEQNGKQDFVQKGSIYYYDESNVRHELTDLNPLDIKNLNGTFYTADGKRISSIFLEKEFKFTKINAAETVDLEKLTITTYQEKIKEDKTVVYNKKTVPLSRYYSEHAFIEKTVDDPKHPGETKLANIVSVRNFEYQPDGEYVAVTINNQRKMVKIQDLRDENGAALAANDLGEIDLTRYIGRKLKVTIDNVTYDVSPLTYVQAALRYNSMKIHKESAIEYSDSSYLKLKNGEYIQEKEAVKPISFKLAEGDNFDKWLVKTVNADGQTIYVVLDKNYFEKHEDTTEYKQANAIRVKQCGYDDTNCIVCQTTSTGAEKEYCAIIKQFNITRNNEIETYEAQLDRTEVLAGVESNYRLGQYQINGVYFYDLITEHVVGDIEYETDRTHKPVKIEENGVTYLQLTNGQRIKESDVVKPVSYKLANDSDFDKWLVQIIEKNGTVSYKVVDKEYFEKTPQSKANRSKKIQTPKYSQENAIKIKQCAFEDRDCVVCQTNSDNAPAEKSVIVKDFDVTKDGVVTTYTAQIEKETVSADVKEKYNKNKYRITKVYLEETKVVSRDASVEFTSKKRYELSDTIEYTDHSADLIQYRGFRAGDIEINNTNGKAYSTARYDIGNGIAGAFSVWSQFLTKGFGVAALAGIFVPGVGAVASAVYAIGMVAAVPLIPLVSAGIGIFANGLGFINKVEYNSKKELKLAKKELEHLHTRMTSDEYVPLTTVGFEAEYEELMHRIVSLSERTVDNGLEITDGRGPVTASNVNKAKQYIKEHNANAKHLVNLEKTKNSAKKTLDRINAEIAKLNAAGKVVSPAKSQAQRDAETAFNAANLEYETYKAQHEASEAHTVGETDNYLKNPKMEKELERLKLFKVVTYLKQFPNSEETREILTQMGMADASPEVIQEMVDSLEYNKGKISLHGIDLLNLDKFKREDGSLDTAKIARKLPRGINIETWIATREFVDDFKQRITAENPQASEIDAPTPETVIVGGGETQPRTVGGVSVTNGVTVDDEGLTVGGPDVGGQGGTTVVEVPVDEVGNEDTTVLPPPVVEVDEDDLIDDDTTDTDDDTVEDDHVDTIGDDTTDTEDHDLDDDTEDELDDDTVVDPPVINENTEELMKRIQDLSAELETVKQEKKQLDEEILDLKNKLEGSLSKEEADKLKNDLAAKEKLIQEKDAEIVGITDKLNKLQKEFDQYKADQEKILNGLNGQISDLTNQIEADKQTKAELEGKITELEESLQGSLSKEEAEKLRNELNEKKTQIEILTEKLNDLQGKYDKLLETKESLEKDLNEANKEIERLTKENEELDKLNKELTGYKDKFEEAEKQIKKLEEDKKKIQTELDEKIKLLGEKDKEISDLQQKLTEYDKQISDLKTQLETLQQENKNLQEENKELNNQIKSLNEEIESVKKARDEALEKLKQKDAEVAKLNKDKEDLNKQIDQLKKDAESYKDKIKKLEDRVEKLKAENKSLKDDNKKLETENEDLKADNKKKKNEIEQLQQENESKKKSLLSIISKQKQEIGTIDDLLKNIADKIEVLEKEIDKLYDDYNVIIRELNAKKDPKEVNKLIREYRKTLKNIDARINQNIKDLKDLRKKASGIESLLSYVEIEESKEIVKQAKERLTTIDKHSDKSKKQSKDVEDINTLELIKIDIEYDVKINSEDALKDLLEDRNEYLLGYLDTQGLIYTESDIKAVIARIEDKHTQGKVAITGAANLKNKVIYDILVKGQAYITEMATFDSTNISDIL